MLSASGQTGDSDWILWDVVAEHLDEAAFAFKGWLRALESPNDNLSALCNRNEPLLLAHIDGLLVGGSIVAERLLEPELSAPEEPGMERSVVAAFALLQQSRLAVVQNALFSPEPLVRLGAERSLILVGPRACESWLQSQVRSSSSPSQRASLLRVGAGRRTPFANLLGSLQSESPEEAGAAALAARRSDPVLHAWALQHLLSANAASVRDATLETLLIQGSTVAFQRCAELAASTTQPNPKAMMLLALLGDRRSHEPLLASLSRRSHARFAIRALGFSGYGSHVEALLPHAASPDPLTAKLAGEAIFNITGLAAPTSGEGIEPGALPPLAEDNLDADLVPGAEEALPLPDAHALTRLCRAVAPSDSPKRLLQGRPWTAARALEALRSAPMRQRHAVALWLRIRTAGAADFETRHLAQHQHAQLAQLQTSVTEESLVLSYSGI